MEDKRLRVMTMYVDAARRKSVTIAREYPVYCIISNDGFLEFEIKNDVDKYIWISSSECMPNIPLDHADLVDNDENNFEGELY